VNVRQKRIVVTHYGGPEVITVAEEAAPTPDLLDNPWHGGSR
jgi:hypothetical protein